MWFIYDKIRRLSGIIKVETIKELMAGIFNLFFYFFFENYKLIIYKNIYSLSYKFYYDNISWLKIK